MRTPTHPSRKNGTNALRHNDLVTVRECTALVQSAINIALAAYDRRRKERAWYRRLWRFVTRR